MPSDPFGALVPDVSVEVAGARSGPLAGLSFAVKDALDVRGFVTGAGNPDWRRTHIAATSNAWAVETLLNAGASVAGKTITDELTFSLNGENVHYGTPRNPKAAGRIPGGSSSGSAVAVAAELIDFALGTDCGGSVRAPASFCGIYGMRPSHGRIPVDGVFRLAPSFDTVGWFARSAELLERVGRVLLQEQQEPQPVNKLLLAADAFDWCGPTVTEALRPAVEKVVAASGVTLESIAVAPDGLTNWCAAFRMLQGAEIWAGLGPWILETKPIIAPNIRSRFDWAATITAQQVAESRPVRDRVTNRMHELLGGSTVLVLPTMPGIAPPVGLENEGLLAFRSKALSLLCIAGLAGLPQINLPLGTIDGCPCGLSIVGAHGADAELLRLATQIAA